MLLPLALESKPRLSLRSACNRAGIELGGEHVAAADALAAARLLRGQLKHLQRERVCTFGELRSRARRPYAFFESFESRLMPAPLAVLSGKGQVPRGKGRRAGKRGGIGRYLDAVLDAVADLELTGEEREGITKAQLDIDADEIRAVHAKVFFGALARFVEDARLDAGEAEHLQRLRALLSALGWAPGDPIS